MVVRSYGRITWTDQRQNNIRQTTIFYTPVYNQIFYENKHVHLPFLVNLG